ncbi:hypothetical protein D3C84_408860 [compost metagenome]
MRQHRTRGMPRTLDVDVDMYIQLRIAGIKKPGETANTGIANQCIQLAEPLHAFFSNQPHGLGIGDVSYLRKHFHAVGVLNVCGNFMD